MLFMKVETKETKIKDKLLQGIILLTNKGLHKVREIARARVFAIFPLIFNKNKII